ncbi:MAG: TnsA endonuclease N-terminal domain-containing protein [Betaproteobacteria bacterium]
MLQWESPNELNAFRLLDTNPTVVGFYEQPLVIRFILNGETHRHYPDILVDFGSTKELWEIKPASEATKPDVAERTTFLQSQLPQKGFTYRVVIGDDLAREPRLSNTLTLLKYGRQPASLIERELVRSALKSMNIIEWLSESPGILGKRHRFVLARLALEGVLTLDREAPLVNGSQFMASRLTWMDVKPSIEKEK